MNSCDASVIRAITELGFTVESFHDDSAVNSAPCLLLSYELPIGVNVKGILVDETNSLLDAPAINPKAPFDKYNWCCFVLVITAANGHTYTSRRPEMIYTITKSQLINYSYKARLNEIPLFNSSSIYVEPHIIIDQRQSSYSDAFKKLQESAFSLIHGKAGVGKTRFLSEVTKDQYRVYINIEHIRFNRDVRITIRELVATKIIFHELQAVVVIDALEQNPFVREIGLNAFLSALKDISSNDGWKTVVLMRTDWFSGQRISDSLRNIFSIFEILPFNNDQQKHFLSINAGPHHALVSDSEIFRIPLMLEFAAVVPGLTELANEYDIINSFYLATLEKKGATNHIREYDTYIGKTALLQYLSSDKAFVGSEGPTGLIDRFVLMELGIIVHNDAFLPQFSHALIRDYFLSRYIKLHLDGCAASPWLRTDISIFDFPVFYFLRAQTERDNMLQMSIPIETDEIARDILTRNSESGINFVCAIYNYSHAVFQLLLQHLYDTHHDIICTFRPSVIKFLLKYGAYINNCRFYLIPCLQRHEDFDIRSLICECIGVANDRSQFDYLAQEIVNNGAAVALWSIRKLRRADRLLQYINFLADPDDSIIATSIKALTTIQFGKNDLEKISACTVPSKARYFKDIILQYPALSDEIVNMLHTSIIDCADGSNPQQIWNNERELLCVIEVISELRKPIHLPFLLAQYSIASSQYLRNAIIDAVGEIRSISSAEWLIGVFETEESALVRGNILWALGNNPTITALAFLRSIASEKRNALSEEESKWLGWALSQHTFSINSHMHVYP